MTDPDNLEPKHSTPLATIHKTSKDLNRLTRHVEDFAVMMTRLEGHRLDSWISTVEKDTLTAVASFACNLRRDIDAVRNGLTLLYSSGPVEGHVNRIMLKRQMFGRANSTCFANAHCYNRTEHQEECDKARIFTHSASI